MARTQSPSSEMKWTLTEWTFVQSIYESPPVTHVAAMRTWVGRLWFTLSILVCCSGDWVCNQVVFLKSFVTQQQRRHASPHTDAIRRWMALSSLQEDKRSARLRWYAAHVMALFEQANQTNQDVALVDNVCFLRQGHVRTVDDDLPLILRGVRVRNSGEAAHTIWQMLVRDELADVLDTCLAVGWDKALQHHSRVALHLSSCEECYQEVRQAWDILQEVTVGGSME